VWRGVFCKSFWFFRDRDRDCCVPDPARITNSERSQRRDQLTPDVVKCKKMVLIVEVLTKEIRDKEWSWLE
jgi:hypothetical protein